MPNKTFDNLKPERRQEIINIAVEEFARHDYQSASLSAIIRRLGLAKGSFYRYFATKKELYLYLIDYIIQKRFERIGQLASAGMDFFDLLRQNFIDKLDFDIKYPYESMMSFNLMNEKEDPDLVRLNSELKSKAVRKAEQAMLPHIKSRRLRSDIPAGLMAYTVVQVQFALIDIIRSEMEGGQVPGAGPVFNLPRREILRHIDQIIELLRHGIINRDIS